MRYLLLLCVVLLGCRFNHATGITVVVCDVDTRQPISEAEVGFFDSSNNFRDFARTDSDGKAVLHMTDGGKVTASKLGYKNATARYTGDLRINGTIPIGLERAQASSCGRCAKPRSHNQTKKRGHNDTGPDRTT
jgi:hypothetical protein